MSKPVGPHWFRHPLREMAVVTGNRLLRLHNPLALLSDAVSDLEWPLIGMTRLSEFATTSHPFPSEIEAQRHD